MHACESTWTLVPCTNTHTEACKGTFWHSSKPYSKGLLANKRCSIRYNLPINIKDTMGKSKNNDFAYFSRQSLEKDDVTWKSQPNNTFINSSLLHEERLWHLKGIWSKISCACVKLSNNKQKKTFLGKKKRTIFSFCFQSTLQNTLNNLNVWSIAVPGNFWIVSTEKCLLVGALIISEIIVSFLGQ